MILSVFQWRHLVPLRVVRFYYLSWRENLLNYQKLSTYYEHDCSLSTITLIKRLVNMKSPQHLNCILEFIWEHALELFSSYIYRLVTCYYKNMTRINFLGDLMTNVNSMSDPCGSCNRFWQQVTTSLTGHKKLIRIKNREVHSRLLCRIFSKHN